MASENETVGNAAKLREAASYLASIFDCDIKFLETHAKELRDTGAYGGGIIEHILHSITLAKAALAAPPRNCDVGDAHDWEERFGDECDKGHICQDCPVYKAKREFDKGARCEFVWAQMPYESEAGK